MKFLRASTFINHLQSILSSMLACSQLSLNFLVSSSQLNCAGEVLGEHAPFTRVFIIGQTKQWVNNTNNAPSPSNKRGADQQERIKIEVVKRCVLTQTSQSSLKKKQTSFKTVFFQTNGFLSQFVCIFRPISQLPFEEELK